MRYYHVAGNGYQEGDPLLCWDELIEAGIEPDWKWDSEPGSFDTDVVCLFDNLAEARDFLSEFGGQCILAIEVPDDNDLGVWPLPWGGYYSPRMTRVDEGYAAIRSGIPAEWIIGEVK